MFQVADNRAYVESLWVSDEELAPILREIDAAAAGASHRNRRRFDRRMYRVDGGIQFEARPAGERPINYIVRPYDLCEQGAGFLHGGDLSPGTQGSLTLISGAGERVTLIGVVTHCRRVRGRIHYVGMSFDETVSIDRFCNLEAGQTQAVRQPLTYDGVKLVALARELIQIVETHAPPFQVKAKLASMQRVVETGLVLNTQSISGQWHPSHADAHRHRTHATENTPCDDDHSA